MNLIFIMKRSPLSRMGHRLDYSGLTGKYILINILIEFSIRKNNFRFALDNYNKKYTKLLSILLSIIKK